MRYAKAIAALLLALLLCLSLCACDSVEQTPVSVQSVAMITGMDAFGLGSRYAGVVQAGQTLAVEKDERLQVKELLVAQGDRVEAGQELFRYDTETLSLDLEKLRLEAEQMKASKDTKNQQIKDLEKEKSKAGKDDQLSYTLQIQQLQIDLAELDLNMEAKQKEISRMESFLEADTVTAPISGRVQAINENGGTDEMGNPLAFLTILETEVYRVKGTVNEQNAGALMPGEPVVIRSRLDESLFWTGTVENVDWENPVQNNEGYWGPVDEMTQSSKYPFYISLDSDEGLMLGQHVFIEPGTPDRESQDLMLPAWCVNDPEGEPWVWAADSRERLEKRSLRLGEYDPEAEAYPVLEGLELTDFIAPDSEDCHTGAPVVFYSESDFQSPGEDPGGGEDWGFEEGFEEGFQEGFGEGFQEDFGEGFEEEYQEGSMPQEGNAGLWPEPVEETKPVEAPTPG